MDRMTINTKMNEVKNSWACSEEWECVKQAFYGCVCTGTVCACILYMRVHIRVSTNAQYSRSVMLFIHFNICRVRLGFCLSLC